MRTLAIRAGVPASAGSLARPSGLVPRRPAFSGAYSGWSPRGTSAWRRYSGRKAR